MKEQWKKKELLKQEINTLLLGAEMVVATVSLSFLLSKTHTHTHTHTHTCLKPEQQIVCSCEVDRIKGRLLHY